MSSRRFRLRQAATGCSNKQYTKERLTSRSDHHDAVGDSGSNASSTNAAWNGLRSRLAEVLLLLPKHLPVGLAVGIRTVVSPSTWTPSAIRWQTWQTGFLFVFSVEKGQHVRVNLFWIRRAHAIYLRRLPSPTHSGRRSLGHAVFTALQVLFSRRTTDRASLAISLALIGPLTPMPTGDSVSSPEVTRCSSVPCRPQTPWCGG